MGKPPFKPSDGDRVDILGVSKQVTENGLRETSKTQVPILAEVRPEVFPIGLPMSVSLRFLNVRLYSLLLQDRPPAVEEDRLARDVVGRPGSQENRQTDNIFRPADSSQRGGFKDAL